MLFQVILVLEAVPSLKVILLLSSLKMLLSIHEVEGTCFSYIDAPSLAPWEFNCFTLCHVSNRFRVFNTCAGMLKKEIVELVVLGFMKNVLFNKSPVLLLF